MGEYRWSERGVNCQLKDECVNANMVKWGDKLQGIRFQGIWRSQNGKNQLQSHTEADRQLEKQTDIG